MPYRFINDPDPDNPMEKQKIPGIAKKLLSDDAAMRGLLQLAIEYAQDLIERNGKYSMPEGPEERFNSYNARADPIVRFARMAFEQGSASDRIAKEDAYHVYRQVMEGWRERTTSQDSFKRHLPRCVGAEVETSRSRALAGDGDDRVRVWKRLKWTDDAVEFMPDWIADRYSEHFEDTDTMSPETPEDDEPDKLAARDPGYGHKFEARITTVNDGEYSRKAQGRLNDSPDSYISYVVPGGNDIEMAAYEHHTIRLEDVTLRKNDDGLLEAVISDAVTISKLDTDANTDTDDDDDADGDPEADETVTETSQTPGTPESPHAPQSPSNDTENTETAADGGEVTTEHTDTDSTLTGSR